MPRAATALRSASARALMIIQKEDLDRATVGVRGLLRAKNFDAALTRALSVRARPRLSFSRLQALRSAQTAFGKDAEETLEPSLNVARCYIGVSALP